MSNSFRARLQLTLWLRQIRSKAEVQHAEQGFTQSILPIRGAKSFTFCTNSRRGKRFRVESRCFDCMILSNCSSLALETCTSLSSMKIPSLIYRILITVGVILSAPGPGFAQTNAWRQLFNGKDMKGWEQVGPGKFVVEDGKLKTVGGMGMLLYPAEKFGDVVIRVVYTVKDNDCNSGVFIRIPEKPADEWVAVNTGYEVQMDNGVRHVGGEL